MRRAALREEAVMDGSATGSGMRFRRWSVGDVTITRIVETDYVDGGLELYFPAYTKEAVLAIDWLRPDFVTPEGLLRYSIHALVIEAGGRRIVVDTCVGNEKPRQLYDQWHMLQTRFLSDLRAAGFSPESIDTVLCTHLHLDHVGWNTLLQDGRWVPTFPRARYLFGRLEYDALLARAQRDEPTPVQILDRAIIADSIAPVVDAGLADFVSADHRICEEVTLIPTHGHTPGHVSVGIASRGDRAFITGDFCHHPCQLVHPDWGIIGDFDPAAATRRRREVFAEFAGTPVLVIGTHWSEPTAGRIEREGTAFRFVP
jgi:glyoxylase-like metal-dependent hydrolase (beta-lactamase superfamily II)